MESISYHQPVFDIPCNLHVCDWPVFYLLDTEPERFDRQIQGVVVSCVDCTDRSRSALENGGPILDFLIEAEYQVDGVTYTCKEHRGSPRKVGSVVTILYNSAKPSDSTLNTDPVAGKKARWATGCRLRNCPAPLRDSSGCGENTQTRKAN